MKKTLIRPTSLSPNSSTPLVSPIIQSNVYVTKDPSTLDKIYNGELNGYTYARERHPNADILAKRINIFVSKVIEVRKKKLTYYIGK